MSDELDFNININPGAVSSNGYMGSNSQKNVGYTVKNSNKGAQGGYQTPSAQNDSTNTADNFEENVSMFDIRKAGHPVASFFTFVFKLVGILSYWFLEGITKEQTLTFIVVILCAAFDFWTVKNVTGRLLVGLRWWSEIQEDGVEKWHFESQDQKNHLNAIDRRVFWWSQTIVCVFWAIYCFLNLISFSLYWGTCTGICLVLSAVNYWGYYKCSKDQQGKINNLLRAAALNGFRKGLGF